MGTPPQSYNPFLGKKWICILFIQLNKCSHFENFKIVFKGQIQCKNARIQVFNLPLTTNTYKHVYFDAPFLLLVSRFHPIWFAQSFPPFTYIARPNAKDLKKNWGASKVSEIFSLCFLVDEPIKIAIKKINGHAYLRWSQGVLISRTPYSKGIS